MISILIPVYNHDVNLLASTLSRQLSAMPKPGEIILLDDGSTSAYRKLNAPTASLPHVKYIEAGANYGRIRIRQMLAEKAFYGWLLFLDCDSQIISDNFIKTYYTEMPEGWQPDITQLIVGGRVYQKEIPGDCSLRLHWKYGSQRETIDPGKRNQDPYHGFMSNNFLVHRNAFDQLIFTNDWNGYGHEDSWIGMQLEDYKIPMSYINNAVLHDGLEKNETFIAKSQQALQNLHKLQKLVGNEQLKKHVKLFRVYSQLKSMKLLWLPRMINSVWGKIILKNLRGCNPSLFYFDIYRLNRFIEIMRST